METIEVDNMVKDDDNIYLRIVKLGGWTDVLANRHKLSTGISLEPIDNLMVVMPIKDLEGSTELTIDQAAQLLQDTLKLTLPTCRVFVEQANDDFKGEDF